MIYDLVNSSDPVLRKPTEMFDFNNPSIDPEELATNLGETMIKNRGVGLAAPQCGYPLSVFVVGDPTNIDSVMAFFNPKIVDISDDLYYYDEGCLSFPQLFIKIQRPTAIRLRFTDMYNETTTTKYTGFTARVIQHEYDHLQGIVFKNKAKSFHLHKAYKDQKLRIRRGRRASL
jgi:peptide deformylase